MQVETAKITPDLKTETKTEAAMALEQLWVETLQFYQIDPGAGRDTFEAVLTAHSAPERYYHNLRHLHEMAQYIETVSHLLEHPQEVALAILFHDFVYDSKNKTNEEQSAAAASAFLTNLGFPADTIVRVEELIMATQKHQVIEHNPDSYHFLDADLAILGREPARYAEYAADIRREYDFVPHDQYCSGRAAVMDGFLKRQAIYFGGAQTAERQKQAQVNIRAEIAMLLDAVGNPQIDWTQLHTSA